MERQIKFRARNRHTGEWLYGDYHREGKTHYITTPKSYSDAHAPIEFIVDEKTLGQFAGVNVCKEDVYEGDICSVIEYNTTTGKTERINCLIIWDDYDASFVAEEINRYDLRHAIGECYRVLGNIHTNPELLEEGER